MFVEFLGILLLVGFAFGCYRHFSDSHSLLSLSFWNDLKVTRTPPGLSPSITPSSASCMLFYSLS